MDTELVAQIEGTIDPNRIAVRKRLHDAIMAAVSGEILTYAELCTVLESVKALTRTVPSAL